MNAHNFTPGAAINRAPVPLTIEQIGHYAPSALATEAHDSRSQRYTYVPTVDVIRGLMREGFQPMKAIQCTSRVVGKQAFTKHMIRFRHQNHLQTGLTVGGEFPEIVLVNSHDGSSSYKIMAGFFRLVCSNGLIVASSTIGEVTVHHKGDIVDNVIEGTYGIAKQLPKVADNIAQWKQLQLSAGEQQTLAHAAHIVRFGDAEGETDTPITPVQLLIARRAEDASPDLWSTMNRIQENVIRGGQSNRGPRVNGNRGRRVTARGVQGIDQDVKLNRAIWTLTEKMAALKAA